MNLLAIAVLCFAPILAQAQEQAPHAASSAQGPLLYSRDAKGPDGYTVGQLVKNLSRTQANLQVLLDYLEPWRKGVEAPVGSEASDAQRVLLAESEACEALISEALGLLEKGVPRAAQPSAPLKGILAFRTRPMRERRRPSIEELQRAVAVAQVNAASHIVSLIKLKGEHAAQVALEAKARKWLDKDLERLAAARKRLAQAQVE